MSEHYHQFSCSACPSKRLQLIYADPEETETELSLLCMDCGQMMSVMLSGIPQKKEAKKTKKPDYTG